MNWLRIDLVIILVVILPGWAPYCLANDHLVEMIILDRCIIAIWCPVWIWSRVLQVCSNMATTHRWYIYMLPSARAEAKEEAGVPLQWPLNNESLSRCLQVLRPKMLMQRLKTSRRRPLDPLLMPYILKLWLGKLNESFPQNLISAAAMVRVRQPREGSSELGSALNLFGALLQKLAWAGFNHFNLPSSDFRKFWKNRCILGNLRTVAHDLHDQKRQGPRAAAAGTVNVLAIHAFFLSSARLIWFFLFEPEACCSTSIISAS